MIKYNSQKFSIILSDITHSIATLLVTPRRYCVVSHFTFRATLILYDTDQQGAGIIYIDLIAVCICSFACLACKEWLFELMLPSY